MTTPSPDQRARFEGLNALIDEAGHQANLMSWQRDVLKDRLQRFLQPTAPTCVPQPTPPREVAQGLREVLAKIDTDFKFEAQFDTQSEFNAYAQGFDEAKDKFLAALRAATPAQPVPADEADGEDSKELLEAAQEVVDNAMAAYTHSISTHGIIGRLKPAVDAYRAARARKQ